MDFRVYGLAGCGRRPASALVRETELNAADFIYPLFITHGRDIRKPIRSMPGIHQLSVDQVGRKIGAAATAGVKAVILFGIPASKDPVGRENFADDGIVQQAVRAIKAEARRLSSSRMSVSASTPIMAIAAFSMSKGPIARIGIYPTATCSTTKR